MRTFTIAEIDLAKKIAEKDFKEITYGDYYSHGDGAWHLCDGHKLKHALDTIDVVPLWQEHDCLEWLKRRGWSITIKHYRADTEWQVSVQVHTVVNSKDACAPTELSALLRAVLAVMEGK